MPIDTNRFRKTHKSGVNALCHSECIELNARIFSAENANQNIPLLHRGAHGFPECCVTDPDNASGYLSGEENDLLAQCLYAGLAYERGRLEEAYEHALLANAAIESNSPPVSKFFASSILIYVLDALGENRQSEPLMNRIKKMIEDDGAYDLTSGLNALAARRRLDNGNAETAREWLKAHGTPPPGSGLIYEAFTTCRAYIVVGSYNLAINPLTRLLQFAKAYNMPLDIIEAQILLSICYWKKKRGFQKEAMSFLEDAVIMSYRFGYTQLFINEGAELKGMALRLKRSMEQRGGAVKAPVNYVKMLYLKMQDSQNPGLTSGQTTPPVKYSLRQKTVMKLLCDGESYRAIAEAMGIKLPTLRSHLSLIYKKLDVTSVSDAVKKINTLGLLDKD